MPSLSLLHEGIRMISAKLLKRVEADVGRHVRIAIRQFLRYRVIA